MLMATSQQSNVVLPESLNPLILPGGRRLPSWKRPGLPRKATVVGTLVRDKSLSPSQGGGSFDSLGSACDGSEGGGAQQRVFQLEKNISFLKQQHRDTLQQLHKEIERLKIENRELHFKLVMCRCGRSGGKIRTGPQLLRQGTSRDDPGTPNDELRAIFLEEEVKELRSSLAQEKSKNRRLMKVIEKKVLEHQKSSSFDQSDNESTSGMPHPSLVGGAMPALPGNSRPPTLDECETIIKHLQATNSQQSHELDRIKADLRDVLYSHKWTPDAFLLARAYVADDKEATNDKRILPNIAASQPPKKMFDRAYQRVKEEVTLPALKPHISNNIADRQRRTLAVKNKLGKSVP